ncbi:SMC-Scp complex subunit ScpB [Ketogulonicigenium vulgare]|uniref:SMC-Scp complex subunit ScpB n=1 Tax=Ketogulonicigenium vulgare TaxID=92945 RepID=UPI0023580C6B|nr:SMC-Scp complex subunit ScpB [Ketogulonicigenium vulgare]
MAFDRELKDLPQALRWREWTARVEAVLFASSTPVTRESLAPLVGRECVIELLIEDITTELRERPYEILRTAGGWQFQTKTRYADAIRAARGVPDDERPFTPTEALVLTLIAYLQPITRAEISKAVGREVGRDLIGRLYGQGLIARGPRSPEAGAPYTYVTTSRFLAQFGLESLRELPDISQLEDAGLLPR